MTNPCAHGHLGETADAPLSPRRNPQCYPLDDARGIFCGYVCARCEAWKKSQYRAEIFTDPNYDLGGDTLDEA